MNNTQYNVPIKIIRLITGDYMEIHYTILETVRYEDYGEVTTGSPGNNLFNIDDGPFTFKEELSDE